jgi:hypothetical protein
MTTSEKRSGIAHDDEREAKRDRRMTDEREAKRDRA